MSEPSTEAMEKLANLLLDAGASAVFAMRPDGEALFFVADDIQIASVGEALVDAGQKIIAMEIEEVGRVSVERDDEPPPSGKVHDVSAPGWSITDLD